MRADYRGVSILELLVVVAVLAIVLGVGALVLPQGGSQLNQVAQRVSQDIQRAKFEAINRNTVVRVDFTGSGYTAIDVRSGAVLFSEQLEGTDFAQVSIAFAGDAIEFDARGVGRTPGVKTITLTHARGQASVVIEVNQQGHTRRVTL